MAFRIEVCSNDETFRASVIDAITAAADEARLAGLVEVAAHDHSRLSPTVVLVAASNSDSQEPLASCVDDAIEGGQPIVPVIDDSIHWQGRLPEALSPMNAVSMADARRGTKILEAAGVMVPLRGVFLSHRRSDGAAMALQLAGELRKYGIGTFVDVLDIQPSAAVQQSILEALDQLACVVLLESPDAIGSWWVAREVVYAQQRHLGTLSLCWAPTPTPDNPGTRFAQFDGTNRVEVGSFLTGEPPTVALSDEGLKVAIVRILHEFAQALFFRRASLEAELDAALNALERRGPWHFIVRGDVRSRLIGIAPYQPDAKDLFSLAQRRETEGADDAVLVYHPITSGTTGALTLEWIGRKGPESGLSSDLLTTLSDGLD